MPAWLMAVTVLVALPLTMPLTVPNGVPLWIDGNTSVAR
jgi:hypothetical protein